MGRESENLKIVNDFIVKYDTRELHPEIKCNFCRAGFGGIKQMGKDNEFCHLDILWSYESGLHVPCTDQETLRNNLVKVDDHQNPEFTPEFQAKLDALKAQFLANPIDFTNKTCTEHEYRILFKEQLDYGCDWLPEEHELKRPETWVEINAFYHQGLSIKDAIDSLQNKLMGGKN